MWEPLNHPQFHQLALTLVHFLWQGAAVAVLLAVTLPLIGRRSRKREAACFLALLAMIVLPVVTFGVLGGQSEPPTGGAVVDRDAKQLPEDHSPTAAGPSPQTERALPPSRDDTVIAEQVEPAPRAQTSGEDPARTGSPVLSASEPTGFRRFAPYIVLIWLAGVCVFGVRLLFGYVGVRRLMRGRLRLPESLLDRAAKLARALRLRGVPAVWGSRRVGEAMVVGFVRPVILLPMTWITQLPSDVLCSVIAHELAHIRRRDQWVNLLQRVVEVLLFYHPAVWWVSRRLRSEREYGCDALAAVAVGGAADYAEALQHVAQIQLNEREILLATSIGGTKMALLKRVRRVLGLSEQGGWGDAWLIGLLAVCIPVMFLVASNWWPSSPVGAAVTVLDDDDDREDRERRERKELREREERERREIRERERDEKREIQRRERDERRERGDRDDKEGEERRDGDRREREDDERREREGDRGERKGDRERRGDRERDERREGDRRPREGDERRRDRERPRDGDRRRDRERPRDGEPRRDGERRRPLNPANVRELMAVIQKLRLEVERLRDEVRELQRRRGDAAPPRGRDRREPPRDRERPPRRTDRRREGDRERERPRRGNEGDRDEKPRGGDRRDDRRERE